MRKISKGDGRAGITVLEVKENENPKDKMKWVVEEVRRPSENILRTKTKTKDEALLKAVLFGDNLLIIFKQGAGKENKSIRVNVRL